MKMQTSFFVLIVVFATFRLTFSQDNELSETWNNGVFQSHWEFTNIPNNEIAEIKKRWEEIGNSLKTTSNTFAGTYFKSGNRGYFLRWSPEKGFVYAFYYETFVIAASYGKVSLANSEIIFVPEQEITYKGMIRKPKNQMVWIPGYKGEYFIRKEDIKSFGNFYGGYKEFNGYPRNWFCDCSPFAFKQEEVSSQESFIIPAKYRKFIKNPINGKIISIGKRKISFADSSVPEMGKISSTLVTIDVGRRSGVKSGMMFLLINEGDNYNQVLKVTKISEKTSQAIVSRSADEKGNEIFFEGWNYNLKKETYKPFPALRVGIKITTSPVLAGF